MRHTVRGAEIAVVMQPRLDVTSIYLHIRGEAYLLSQSSKALLAVTRIARLRVSYILLFLDGMRRNGERTRLTYRGEDLGSDPMLERFCLLDLGAEDESIEATLINKRRMLCAAKIVEDGVTIRYIIGIHMVGDSLAAICVFKRFADVTGAEPRSAIIINIDSDVA